MKGKILTTLFVMLAWGLQAQLSLTLSESIELALQNNKQLLKAREEVLKYKQDYNNVRGNLLPQISLAGGYQYGHTRLPDSAIPPSMLLADELTDEATTDDSTIADFFDYSLAALIPEQETDEYSAFGQLKLDQVVFMGGKLINGINIAGKLYHLQEKRYFLVEQEVVFNAKDLYYKTKLAGEVLEIQREALSYAQDYFQQISNMFEQGLVSEYDMLRAELEVQKLKPEVMEAEKNNKIAQENFSDFLGLETNELILSDAIELITMEDIMLNNAIDEALENRMELELSAINVDVNKVQLRYEKGNFLPNIGISAEYNVFGADAEKIESDDWGNSYQVGIGFSMPIFTGFSNSAKIKKAKHSLRQAELDRKDLQEKIELDVTNSFLQLETDLEKVETQLNNVNLAERGLEIAEARYNNQVSNQLELIDAQLQLKIARLNLMNVKYSAVTAYEKLLKAMGRNLL
jgi:outer membrane protein TolC